MRSYVIVAGAVFGLVAAVHLWRMIVEPHLARDPWFLLTTIAAVALSAVAWTVVHRSGRS
jgi:hypothetical protein